jgi:tRNA(Ile)-lysidine synthase
MACALLAHDWAKAHRAALTTLTVDHGLRPESRAEAEQVAGWMEARGIAHYILTPLPMPEIRNPQAQARARRYKALGDYCRAHGTTHLLLGHHADDQAETVALQRHRGSNPASRAGMAFVSPRHNLNLVRPLLGVRKRNLITYLESQHQPWMEDPSNQSDRYARNRLRQTMNEAEIIALWHEAQTQGTLRHASDVAHNAWMGQHARVSANGVELAFPAWRALANTETRMDYLSHAIRAVGGKAYRPRYAESARLATQLMADAQGTATLGHCLIRWGGDTLTLMPEPAHHPRLDAPARAPHMELSLTDNALVKPPFWWFNMPLHTALE